MSSTIPSLLSVVYSNDRITVTWSGSATSYTLTLFKDGAAVQSTQAFGFTGFLQSPVLDTTSVFTVAVAETISGGTGPYSSSAPVIVGPPLNVQVAYDGEAVLVTWSPPAGATVARGAEVDVLQGTTAIAAEEFVGTQGTFVPSPPFDPSQSYSLTVRGQSGISSGPKTSAIAIVQTAPDLARLTYTKSGTTSRLTAVTTTGDVNNQLGIYLYVEEKLAAQGTGTAFQAMLDLNSLLDPGQLNTVRLALLATSSRGPLSTAVPAVVEPPTLSAIAYDGTNVSASWNFLPNTPAATAATVTVIDASGKTIGGRQFAGNSGSFPLALTAGTTYTASAVASRAGSAGPSGAALAVIASVPALTSITYDGARLIASWSNSNGPGVTGTLLHLQSGGVDIVPATRSGAQSGIVDAALDSSGAYDLALQAAGTSSLGPISGTTAVISAIPSITSVTYATGTSNQVTVNWNASDLASRHGVSGYRVQLYENGAAKGAAVVISDKNTGTAALTATLDAWKSYSVTVQATGTKAFGPLSPSAAVIATTPLVTSVVYDGTNAVVTWSAPIDPGITGFTARLVDDANTIFGSEVDTASLIATLPLTPAQGKTYSVQVRAVAASSKGAWGTGVPVLIETMTLATAVVTSPFVDVTWRAATETLTTGYEVRIAQSGTLTATVPASGITTVAAHVHLPLDPAGSYTASVRPVSGVSFGIESTALNLISAVPEVTRTVAASGQVTVHWNASVMAASNGVTGYSVQLYENGAAKGDPVVVSDKNTGSAVIAATLDAWKSYSVTVTATGTNSTGSASAAAPIIPAVPQVDSTAYDGANVVASWSAPNDPNVIGYAAAVVDQDGNVAGTEVRTNGSSATIALTPASGKTYGVRVRALGATNAEGADSDASAAPVVLASMSAGSASYDGRFLEVRWTASGDANVSGYVVRVYEDDILVAIEDVSGQSAAKVRFELALSDTAACSVTVAATGGVGNGQESAALPVISAIPTVTAITYSTATPMKITVTWNAAVMATRNGVTGYSVQLDKNGAAHGDAVVVSSKDTGSADIPLASALEAWNRYSVTVQATGTNTTGATSAAEGVIASIPVITSASISGFAWSLAWTAAAEEFVTGYRVTVTDAQGQNEQTFDTTQTALALPNTFANNQSQATVQAIGATAKGQASAAASLYGRGASYYFSPTGGSAPAYLFRASSQPAGASTINLYLPDLFNGTPSIQNDVFVLTKPATSASYPYLITIAQNSVAWQFTSDARTALWNAYLQFLTDLDVMVGSQPQLKPGAFTLIAQVLGRALPLLFSEQLGYVYRFNAAGGTVDLVPGMRLRIDSEARQYSGPPSTSNVNINGFVSSGTSLFDLGEYWQGSQLNTGFNSYLSLTGRPSVPGTNTTGGAAGGLDFYPALNRMPLFRLLYPAQFPPANGNGYADLTDNIAIIGANLFGDLQGATAQYIANGNFSGYESKISQTWFRGRAVITPEIPILVNGALEYVALGTTVRQLLGLFGGGAWPAGSYAGGLSFRRAINNIVDDISVAVPPEAIRTNEVRIADLALNAYTGGIDALDTPVIQGDSFTFGAA